MNIRDTDRQVWDIPVADVHPECNDRTEFDPVALRELADSILENGLAQPITVRPRPAGGWWIVAGERRWRAHRMLEMTLIPAIVRDLDDGQAADIMLVENMARRDLNPIEEAVAYRARLDAGSTVERLARVAGVNTGRITARVALLGLADDVQRMVTSGQLPVGFAQAMTGLDADRQHVALAALARGLSGAEFDLLCGSLRAEQGTSPMFDPDTFLQVDEYVVKARRDNVHLNPKQMAALCDQFLQRLDDVVDDWPEDLAMMRDQIRGAVDFRLKRAG